MKILFLVSRDSLHTASAGGDIQANEWAKYLAGKGHSVTYICGTFKGSKKKEIIDGVEVIRVGPGNLLFFYTFFYYMLNCRGKYDVVYEEVISGAQLPLLAPLYVREPILAAWHQRNSLIILYQFPKPLRPLLNLAEKYLAYVHRNVIIRVPSADRINELVDLSLPLKNLKVIPASIPEEWTHIKITSKREPLIVWLGKIRRYKCPHHVVLAMKQVCQEYPEAKLIIAGKREDVKYERELRYLAQKKGISENVEIMTNLTEREKRDLLLRAKVLVLPSPIEGFGIVVLEANACGTPVIASSGVPKDAVQHLNNGLRYPFNDISALTNSILQVLKDDELFKQLSNNSLTFVRQFAWSKVSAQFENLVKLVAEQRK